MIELPEWIGDFLGWVIEHVVDLIMIVVLVGGVGGLGYALFYVVSTDHPSSDTTWEVTTQAGEVLAFDDCYVYSSSTFVVCNNGDGLDNWFAMPIKLVEIASNGQ